jgi:hypothetical protein
MLKMISLPRAYSKMPGRKKTTKPRTRNRVEQTVSHEKEKMLEKLHLEGKTLTDRRENPEHHV